MSKTNQLLAKLQTMAGRAGEAIFERAGMAYEVLSDNHWIETEHGGDPEKAMKAVEEICFPELGKAFPLSRLLAIRKAFPTLEEWRQWRCNLQRLSAELYKIEKKNGPQPGAKGSRTTKEVVLAKEEKIDELSIALKRADSANESKDDQLRAKDEQIHRLTADLNQATARIAHLEGRVEELQRENAALHRLLSREPVSVS